VLKLETVHPEPEDKDLEVYWGAGVAKLRKIYQLVIILQMIYGCSVWSVAHEHGVGYTK
jgi:hypothetical protein